LTVTEYADAIWTGTIRMSSEIEDGLRETIIANADQIDDFSARREELGAIDGRYLILYSCSMLLFWVTEFHKPSAATVNAVISDIAQKAANALSFKSTKRHDPGQVRDEFTAQLQAMFGNVADNLRRLLELSKTTPDDQANFTFMLMYLNKVYPPSASLFGNAGVFVQLLQMFGQLSMSSHRYLALPD
jgi:hypothetical protein